MTREEAIEVLLFLKHDVIEESDQYKAFDMAIEALEENESLAKRLNDAAELIHKLQNKNEWIPCSEHLPEGEVLCCDIHQNLMLGYVFVSEKSNTGYSAESESEYMYECVAWMPLPSPYKAESEDKE